MITKMMFSGAWRQQPVYQKATLPRFGVKDEVEITSKPSRGWINKLALNASAKNQTNLFTFAWLQLGVNVNIQNQTLQTPLMLFTKNINLYMVKTLLDFKDVKRDVQDEDGYTALHHAAEILIDEDNEEMRQDAKAILHLLIYSGATLNKKDYETGCTPLMILSQMGDLEDVQKLAEAMKQKGLSLSETDRYGKTAQDYAKEAENQEIAEFLAFEVENT